MIHRREFLKASCAAGAALLPAWPATYLFADAASAAESSAAGDIAQWVGGKIGGEVATLAMNQGLAYLGLDPNGNVSGSLDEINQKLDAILSQLDVLNTKIDALQSSINQLTADVDVGLKQAYASISDASLVDDYGWINTTLGSRTSGGSSSLYGLMHLPPSGHSGVAARGTEFLQLKQQIWSKIHHIHYVLTIQAGSSESLLQKWATLVTAKLRAKGLGGMSLTGYAAVYEAWFTQAISYQMKAYVMLLFIAGSNTEQQTSTREEMLGLLNEECARYLDGLDRLALSAARPAPSGPSRNTLLQVQWADDTGQALLRADVYTLALTSSFNGDTHTPQAQKVSGVYGRIVLRPSDLTADGKAPNRIAFAQYPVYSSYWPQTQRPGLATLGAATEFQSIDWSESSDAFGKLKSGGRSTLRFGRYFWPTPARPQSDVLDFQPFGYFMDHWTDRPLRRNPGTGEFFTSTRPKGRVGIPTYRQDAAVMLFGIADLVPQVIPRFQPVRFRYQNGLPVSSDSPDPYVVLGKSCGFVIGFLDGWSGPSMGAQFTPAAPRGEQQTAMSGSSYLSWQNVTATTIRSHLMEFDAGALRSKVESRAALPPDTNWLDFSAVTRCAWTEEPGSNHRQQNASASYSLPLFSTASDESGAIQVVFKGNLALSNLSTANGVTFGTTVRFLIQNDKGDPPFPLLTLTQPGDFLGTMFFASPSPGPNPLRPNARYSLVIALDAAATFAYHYVQVERHGSNVPSFPNAGDVRQRVGLTLSDFGICRPAGTGYQSA
jgi:hypothetical protein